MPWHRASWGISLLWPGLGAPLAAAASRWPGDHPGGPASLRALLLPAPPLCSQGPARLWPGVGQLAHVPLLWAETAPWVQGSAYQEAEEESRQTGLPAVGACAPRPRRVWSFGSVAGRPGSSRRQGTKWFWLMGFWVLFFEA